MISKLKVDYIDLETEIKYSCLIKGANIVTKEDKERVKQKIINATKNKNIDIINWKKV